MKLQHKVLKALLTFVILFAINFLIGGHTLTATAATTTDTDSATETIAQALPDANASAKTVKTALLASNATLTADSTLAEVANANPTITITDNLTDYQPLIGIAKDLGGLHLNDQASLSQVVLTTITQAMLTNRTNPAISYLDFSSDKLGNAAFAAFIATLSKNLDADTTVETLSFSQNEISDFTPWTKLRQKEVTTKKVQFLRLTAPVQDTTAGTTLTNLSGSTLTGSTLTIPFADFPELTTQFYLNNSLDTVAGIRIYHDDTDYFSNATNLIPDGFGRVNEDSAAAVVPISARLGSVLPYDSRLLTTFSDTDTNTTFYQPLTESQWESLTTAEQTSPSMFTNYPSPADQATLKITDIPETATNVKVRIAVNQQSLYAFTQTYTIPLNRNTTSTTTGSATTNSASSNSAAPTSTTQANKATAQDKIVYATQKIGLYRQPTFTTKNRLRWYPKESRTQRPMFKVIGYARSKNGRLRYKVKDVTPNAKTAGQIGYITTKEQFVSNAYYQSSATKIKVLRGLNSYANTTLTGKRTHYRRNQVIRVKKLVWHNLTTRYQLPNGRYVSANKRLVLR